MTLSTVWFKVHNVAMFLYFRCPNDSTVKFHPAHSLSAQRFSLEAFKFIADHPFVFIHCHVILCNATDPSSKCAKKCQSRVRQTREVSDHMIDDVYHLAQGPLHLSRKKREEKADKAANNSGESINRVLGIKRGVFCYQSKFGYHGIVFDRLCTSASYPCKKAEKAVVHMLRFWRYYDLCTSHRLCKTSSYDSSLSI